MSRGGRKGLGLLETILTQGALTDSPVRRRARVSTFTLCTLLGSLSKMECPL